MDLPDDTGIFGLGPLVSRKGPMLAAVITEFEALLRVYLAMTSDGREDTLKFAMGLYGVIGVDPGPLTVGAVAAAGAVATAGEGAVDLNAVKDMPERSSETKSGIQWSLLMWNSILSYGCGVNEEAP